MKTKVIAIIMMILFLASITAIAVPVRAGYGTPNIDGVISAGEWGEPTFEAEGYFDVYVLNDMEYLYVGFEAKGGTYLPTGGGDVGMINVYTMNLDTGECWAYCWIHRTPDYLELVYSPPRTPGLPTGATFAVTERVFELQIPLSELTSISLGDTIGFHFLSYSQGLTNWNTCWLYDQEYTLVIPPAYWFKASAGGVSYSDASETPNHYCTLGVIGMSLEPVIGSGNENTVLCKGSGTFIDHDLKIKISFEINSGSIARWSDYDIFLLGTAKIFDIEDHAKYYNVPVRVSLVDDAYSWSNRFDVRIWGTFPFPTHWHGTLLPDSEVTVWVWE